MCKRNYADKCELNVAKFLTKQIVQNSEDICAHSQIKY